MEPVPLAPYRFITGGEKHGGGIPVFLFNVRKNCDAFRLKGLAESKQLPGARIRESFVRHMSEHEALHSHEIES